MVTKRNGGFFIFFRPFKDKLVGLKLPVKTKSEASEIEIVIKRACRMGNFGGLDEVAREAATRMFMNQGWELPSEMGGFITKPQGELSLRKACGIFLNYPEIKVSKAKVRYQFAIRRLVQHFGETVPVESIWIPDLKAYRLERLSQGAAPATINREISTLSRVFRVLIELRHVDTNPVYQLERLPEKSGERQVYISHEDFHRILDELPAWFRPIAQAAYYTGMRRGELLELNWKQVNSSGRMITLSPDDTKECHWKRIPIHQELVPVFEQVMRVRALSTDKVFLIDGRPPHFESIKNPWRKACRSLELNDPRPRFHDLRHTWRANARRSSVDADIAEAIMGHQSRARKVHERYGRISDQELVAAIDKMTFDHGATYISVSASGKR